MDEIGSILATYPRHQMNPELKHLMSEDPIYSRKVGKELTTLNDNSRYNRIIELSCIYLTINNSSNSA